MIDLPMDLNAFAYHIGHFRQRQRISKTNTDRWTGKTIEKIKKERKKGRKKERRKERKKERRKEIKKERGKKNERKGKKE